MSKVEEAKQDFCEVLVELDDRLSNPEKATLYEGLVTLSDAIIALQREVASLKKSR